MLIIIKKSVKGVSNNSYKLNIQFKSYQKENLNNTIKSRIIIWIAIHPFFKRGII